MRAFLLVSTLLFALSPPGPAEAQRPQPTQEQISRARTLFVEGSGHYQAGRLNEALDAFLEAWRILPNPALAYNVARTYERISDTQRSIEFYGHYLRHAAPDATERAEVERRIAALRAVAARLEG